MFPIPELTDEMLEEIRLDDGSVDEWYDLVGDPTMTLLDFSTYQNALSPDPSNLDFRFWLAWEDDPDRLYIAFVSSDDFYKNDHDYNGGPLQAGITGHDSIVISIDGNHSGGQGLKGASSQEEVLEAFGQTQRYEVIARTTSGPTMDNLVRHWTEMFSWKVFPPYGDAGGSVAGENPTISVIELYITPFDSWGAWDDLENSVPSDLTAGQIVGFGLIVHDFDQEEWGVSWTPEAVQSEDAEIDIRNLRADIFLDGLLLPAKSIEPEGSAVESVTWGRIKAAIELE